MNPLRINKLAESDFDSIVFDAGGKRFAPEVTEDGYFADYILNEAILELKLIGEEGILKENRKRKIADIFRENQPNKPTVVLDPTLLSTNESRKYYSLIKQPIQTAVKKASKQLIDTEKRLDSSFTKVLIIMNDGYSALDNNEFVKVVSTSVRNDTSNIDYIIVGGIYFYSDGYDSYFFPKFESIPININHKFPSFQKLHDSWKSWEDKYMTAVVQGQLCKTKSRLPVADIHYNIDGIDYVKPPPPMGKTSSFWPSGIRPRENTTGIDSCPPVAICFPKLSMNAWADFRNKLGDLNELQDTYQEWIAYAKNKEESEGTDLQPFIPIEIDINGFNDWWHSSSRNISFYDLCRYATKLFEEKVRLLISAAIDKNKTAIVYPLHIYLLTEEIGQNRALDISSIYKIQNLANSTIEKCIIKNKKIFYEYAIALAASYAIKYGIELVVYERDETYKWK